MKRNFTDSFSEHGNWIDSSHNAAAAAVVAAVAANHSHHNLVDSYSEYSIPR